MRMVGEIADEAVARRFVDYLLTIEVRADARKGSQGWTVWVEREDQLDRGRAELREFLSDPDAPRYREASAAATHLRREAQRAEREHERKSVPLGERLNTITPKRCPVTHVLIALSVLFAMISSVGANRLALEPFYFSPPVVVQTSAGPVLKSAGIEPIKHGELWRFWTPIFIHYGWAHLLFNMIALYQFGGMIELRKSWVVLLGLAAVSAPVANVAQYVWDQQTLSPGAISLPGGMSGVVYALFGYVWMKSDYEPDSHLRISNNVVMTMLAWLVLCMTGIVGPIANAAHLGGLIYGMCVGVGPHFWERFAPRS